MVKRAPSLSLVEDREKTEVAGCQVGTAGVVVQNMKSLLFQEGRGDLGFMGRRIFMEEHGFRGADGWALIANFLDNFWKHDFVVVCGCD